LPCSKINAVNLCLAIFLVGETRNYFGKYSKKSDVIGLYKQYRLITLLDKKTQQKNTKKDKQII